MANKNSISSVLIALSDIPTLTIISYHLERYGFVVNNVSTTDSFLKSVERIEPSIIILDEDMPGSMKTKDLCSILKNNPKTNHINIVYISKAAVVENQNINDSLIKPFIPSELVGKVKALSTHTQSKTSNNKRTINYHDIEMNLSTFRVSRQGRQIHLGPNEFKIFQCFLELPGKTLSREHIMNYVWGHNSHVEPRTIDVHINRLRSALKNNDDEMPLIKTIRSSGYSLNMPKELVRA
jgi:two-component system phosphate regulon response regulator PhoB